MKSPENGGYFYAHKVLSECKVVQSLSSEWAKRLTDSIQKGDSSAARSSALRTLQSRCESLTADEVSDENVARIYSNGVAGNDPLFAASRSYDNGASQLKGGNATQAKRQGAIAAASRVSDPLVVQDLGLRLVVNRNDESGRTTFRANGSDVPLNSKVDTGLATFLVPCELGLKCDSNDFAVLLPCASQGICDGTRRDAIRRMAAESGKDYEGIAKASKSIANSLTNQHRGAKALD